MVAVSLSNMPWTIAVVFIAMIGVLLAFGAIWLNSHLHS